MSQTTIDDFNNPESGREEIEREARNWVMRFTSGAGTREDLKASQNWCERSAAHAEAFARACHLWESLGPDVFDTAACPRRGIGVHVTRRVVLGGATAASSQARLISLFGRHSAFGRHGRNWPPIIAPVPANAVV